LTSKERKKADASGDLNELNIGVQGGTHSIQNNNRKKKGQRGKEEKKGTREKEEEKEEGKGMHAHLRRVFCLIVPMNC